MAIEKLSDIPADRPLTLAERKALLKEMQDARGRLICAESSGVCPRKKTVRTSSQSGRE